MSRFSSGPDSAFKELRNILRDDVLAASQRLIGTHLVAHGLRAAIVETEAYRAEDDPACHGYRGPTPRTGVMFERPGLAYVYFSYGCHWMLNVTCHEVGRGAAVLIRAAMPLEGLEEMRARRARGSSQVSDKNLLSGPGKLAQAFAITGANNGLDLLNPDSPIRIEVHEDSRPSIASTRIGIAEGKADDYPWRFIDRDRTQWASPPRPRPIAESFANSEKSLPCKLRSPRTEEPV